MLPVWSEDSGFTGQLASLANYRRVKLVDRHGFAPCSPACEAGDLLNDRAAQDKWLRGLESNQR